MPDQLYLVDFENVPGVDLSGIGLECRVIVFTGASQKSVTLELVAATQRFGDRLEWRRVDANGHNALDFFIACELGRVQASANGTNCTVLSNDKGFDPLLRYLNAVGVACQRIGTVVVSPPPKPAPKPKVVAVPPAAVKAVAKAKAKPKAPKAPAAPKAAKVVVVDPANYARVLEILGKVKAKSRPLKHKGLASTIASYFQKKLSKAEVSAIIVKMIADKKIADKGGAITYGL